MASSILQIILKAVDQTNAAFDNLTGNINKLGGASQKVLPSMQGWFDKNTKSTNKFASSITGLVKGAAGFAATAAPYVAAAAAVGLVAKKLWEVGSAGAQVQRVLDSGAKVAGAYGVNMTEAVEKVRAASLGTVSEYDATLATSQALMFGLRGSAEQFGQLMEIAAVRGRAFGMSATQSFSDIVRGIGRMSPLILDNIGITIDAANTYKAYAESIGKTARELSSVEKRQALLNRVLEEGTDLVDKMGGLMWDNAAAYEAAGAAWKDYKNEVGSDLGEMFAKPLHFIKAMNLAAEQAEGEGLLGWLNAIIDVGTRVNLEQANLVDIVNDLMLAAEGLTDEEVSMFNMQLLSQAAEVITVTTSDMELQAAFMDDLTKAREKYNEVLAKSAELEGPERDAMRAEALGEFGESIEDVTLKLAEMGDASNEVMMGLGVAFGEVDATAASAYLSIKKILDDPFLSDQQKIEMIIGINFVLGGEGVTPEGVIDKTTAMMNDMIAANDGQAISTNIQLLGKEETLESLDAINNYQIGDKSYNVVEYFMRVSGTSGGDVSETARFRMGAYGGEFSANKPYIIGERGPEIFQPNSSGTIIPNNKIGGGSGVTVNINYNPLISTASYEEAVNIFAPMVEDVLKDRLNVGVL